MAPEKQARRRRGHATSPSPASAPKGTLQHPHRSPCCQPRLLPQGIGQPLALRDPGEDAPRPPLPRQGRPARGSSARWARVSSRGHCLGCEGEDTVQPPSAGIRHVRAAAEPPLPAEPAAPPPFCVPRTAGEGDRRHRRSVHPGVRPLLPPRHRSHAALSAMLARRPLTLRPPPPPPSRVRGSRCPPARPPHCGPAPPGAPGDRGSSGSDSFRRSPSAAAGGSRSRPTPPGGERAAGGTGPIPKPPRPSPPRYCPPAAPPPFPATTTTAPRPSLHCPEPQAPGRGKPLTLPPAAGDHRRSGPVRSLGWASALLPSLTPTTSPTGGERPRTPAPVLT
ncbi:uncharacterized protein LOC128809209 [Vidua macroura]|uniref:uncharacterized protein LOC128809209 n=1 Tax=Vidua macroura TaxID=187451 RepID=UPI0023A87D30|nr:uncharacterized protein LOC128809209 [Vidua macroura]